jgi:hypothetical protein
MTSRVVRAVQLPPLDVLRGPSPPTPPLAPGTGFPSDHELDVGAVNRRVNFPLHDFP